MNNEYSRYGQSNGPQPDDLNFIAERLVAYGRERINNYREKGRTDYRLTTEDVIELFRGMNDDYDDWWARGLYTKEMQKEFIFDLLTRMEKLGLSDIENNTWV